MALIPSVAPVSDAHIGSVIDDRYTVVTARSRGAAGDGTTDDTADVATAQTDAAAFASANTRATLSLSPGDTYKIGQRVAANVSNGGVFLEQGVDFDGQGAQLLLANNTSFITNQWPICSGDNGAATLAATITVDVAIDDTQYTVNSTTGFTAGDDVFVRMNDNAADDVEVKDAFFAKVVSVDSSTLITLDRPSPAVCDVSDTEAGNKVIQKLYGLTDGTVIRDLVLVNPQTGSANAESGIDLRYARNTVIENITATDPGAGAVILGYPENVTLRNIRVRSCDQQGGQTSKGRALTIWNGKNVRIENLAVERFEGVAAFIESYSHGITFDGVHIVNNHPDRVQASNAIFQVAQGSDVQIRNLILEGNGGTVMVDTGATTGNTVSFENLWINTATEMKQVPLKNITGSLRIGNTIFDRLVTRRIYFRLSTGMNSWRDLPYGMYRRVFVYVTNKTGITNFTMSNFTAGSLGDLTSQLSNGDIIEANNDGLYGTDYSFNDYNNKAVYIETDGSVVAGSHGFIEIEYWPESADDGSHVDKLNPLTMTAANGSALNTGDATSDTVIGNMRTRIAELESVIKQAGWIA